MPPKRKSTRLAARGAKRRRVTEELQENEPSELNNEPSTSGTFTAPSIPATTTTNTDLTATIVKAVAEGVAEGVAKALKGQTSQRIDSGSVQNERDSDEPKKSESTPPITLGNLFKQDMETMNILPYYPSSYDQKYLINKKKYLAYSKKARLKNKKGSQVLYPGRICSIAGNEFPILMDKQPSDSFMAHWKKWLQRFPEPVFKTVSEGVENEDPIVTVFPMERIPKEKHAIDPDMHYHVLLKSAIPEVGAPCPKHFTQEDAVFPCMVKVDQCLGGYGNHVAYNEKQLADKLEMIKKEFGQKAPYVITEFVQNVEETLGCQFYLNKKGEVHWLGTNVNLLKDFAWVGNMFDWDLRQDHRKRVYDSFILPVADYLHKKGYFGIVGIDIITSPSGDYLVDMNARITGFTPHALIAPEMAREGLTKSLFKKREAHKCSTEELIKKANYANEKTDGKILILNSMNVDEGCIAAIVAFGQTMADVEGLFKRLTDEK